MATSSSQEYKRKLINSTERGIEAIKKKREEKKRRMAEKYRKNKADIAKSFEISAKREFEIPISISTGSTQTATSNNSNSQEEAKEEEKPKVADYSISDALNEVFKAKTENIINATERAIRLGFIEKNIGKDNEKNKYETMIVYALDNYISDQITNAAEAYASFVSEQHEEIGKKSKNHFDDLFQEFTKVMYLSRKIKEGDKEKEDTPLIDTDAIEAELYRNNGFLTVPLQYQERLIDEIEGQEKISGKEERGLSAYRDFIDNLSVINIFREDIFSIF